MKINFLFTLLFLAFFACKNENATQKVEDNAAANSSTIAETFQQPKQTMGANPSEMQAGEVENPTSIKYESELYEFGTVNTGAKVRKVFKFTNTGENPLIITNAEASCGCTVPTWSKEPVAPGKSGEMLVIFDTAGKEGLQEKRITVTANTNPPVSFLIVKGTVKPAAAKK
jgi:hypothetical protein